MSPRLAHDRFQSATRRDSKRQGVWAVLALALSSLILTLAACSGGGSSGDQNDPSTPDVTPPPVADNDFDIRLPDTPVTVIEGGETVELPLQLVLNDDTPPIELSVIEQDLAANDMALQTTLADSTLAPDSPQTILSMDLPIGALRIEPQQRTVTITAVAGSQQSQTTLVINVTPTDRPDIFLLAGQSNMVGFSGTATKEAETGEIDAPVAGIEQLNVTDNSPNKFPTVASFSDPDAQASALAPYILAEDPLHDTAASRTSGKNGDYIGMGLSFAKAAAGDADTRIVLVPAAWSDSGFCLRDSLHLDAMGWLAEDLDSDAFAGTLLHDRAITRTNRVIAETGGILRGILWHQGEAEVNDPECAEAYAQNLSDMVESLRSSIDEDARGSDGRGPDSNVPFVVGTMSQGGDFAEFSELKQLVDAVHRQISQTVPFSAVVNNDDLVPPAFPCGQTSCIHFGASAYRETGARYYQALRQASDP